VISEHLQQVNSVSGLLKSEEIECDIRLERVEVDEILRTLWKLLPPLPVHSLFLHASEVHGEIPLTRVGGRC
jgi:hypothetical protein